MDEKPRRLQDETLHWNRTTDQASVKTSLRKLGKE
jgi:hypothetical protein